MIEQWGGELTLVIVAPQRQQLRLRRHREMNPHLKQHQDDGNRMVDACLQP